MIVKMISFLFNKIIGRVPPEQRKELEKKFMVVLTEAIKAGVAGAKR
jgi:hypothetical protein